MLWPLLGAVMLVFVSCTQKEISQEENAPEEIPTEERTDVFIPPNPPSVPTETVKQLPSLPKLSRAPELAGLGTWFNSEPFTLESLRGKVVLVDFWTYSCINCIRTFPALRGYWDKFKDKPFILLGVHSPEFTFEKLESNVADAIKRHNLTYPIVQDNDFQTWRAFANRYWPAKYLIDAEVYIRYTHFGEGDYEETDLAIQSLLAEIGQTVEAETLPEEEDTSRRDQTPETYLSSRSWPSFENGPSNPSNKVMTYSAAGADPSLHHYSLDGSWQLLDDERQVLQSDSGEIRMTFQGSEINLVLGKEGDTIPTVEVFVDGVREKTFTVEEHKLYELWKGPYGEHGIVLGIHGKGLSAFAFTFGSK